MAKRPDFFMTAVGEMSAEADLSRVRACWAKGRVRTKIREDGMLIEVDPPVIGQHYGLGGEDITELLISPRLEGYTLFPVAPWPCHVYVLRIVDNAIKTSLAITQPDQAQLIAWAELFRRRGEAEAKVEKARARDRCSQGGEG